MPLTLPYMPTINKKYNKPRKIAERPRKRGENKTIVSKIYNSKQWKYLRNSYLQEHPLCEDCLAVGQITPAAEIHHVRPILTASTVGDMEALAFDPANLRSLCVYHHHLTHQLMKDGRFDINENEDL